MVARFAKLFQTLSLCSRCCCCCKPSASCLPTRFCFYLILIRTCVYFEAPIQHIAGSQSIQEEMGVTRQVYKKRPTVWQKNKLLNTFYEEIDAELAKIGTLLILILTPIHEPDW